jgi:penicillin-binding protein 1C
MPFEAPHFTEWVLRRHPEATNLHTTLDRSLQMRAAECVESYVEALRPLGIGQGAAVILDYERGELVAMIGSAGFLDSLHQGQVNGALARRSPGSTLKPFVYALAFDCGLATPATLLTDVPVHFGAYSPENYDGLYQGMIRASCALQTSRNVPAVILASELERKDRKDRQAHGAGATPCGGSGLHGFLRRCGVVSLDRPSGHYGLSLVLGGGEVTLLELARLYATLAHRGEYLPVRVKAGSGGSWFRPRRDEGAGGTNRASGGTRVLSAGSCYLTLETLVDVTRPDLNMVWRSGTNEVPIPWKTGTSYGHRDAWSVGIAGSYVAAVWLGNFDGTGCPHLVGCEVAAPLLFDLIDLLPRTSVGDWHIPPDDIRMREVCAVSGAPAGEHCPETRWEPFIPGVSPSKLCQVHREIAVDTETGYCVCSRCRVRGRYETEVVEWWPPEVATYLAANGIPVSPLPAHNPDCPIFGSREAPLIVSPQEEMEYRIRQGVPLEDQKVALVASVSTSCHELFWFLDGELVWNGSPSESAFLSPVPGEHTLSVADDAGRTATIGWTVVG